jgi:hypothetical protein
VAGTAEKTVFVDAVRTESVRLAVLGTRPIILNRLSEKARHELLFPQGRKTGAARASSLKHDPIREFRDSPYTLEDDDAPTFLAHMSSAFKGAMMNAALDLPGAKKTQIGRLLWVEGEYTPIYGIPQLHMAVTRSADMNRTPDIRTRCIVPRWAATVTVTYTVPLINERSVINLAQAAGTLSGVGDWRPEKGKGVFGQFTLVDPDDETFQEIVRTGGRAAQMHAMDNPEAYDREARSLLAWFEVEATSSGKLKRLPAQAAD